MSNSESRIRDGSSRSFDPAVSAGEIALQKQRYDQLVIEQQLT